MQNNPIYVRSFNSQTEELKFHYIVHSALDLVEERCKWTCSACIFATPVVKYVLLWKEMAVNMSSVKNKQDGSQIETFLGLLYPIEDFRV